MSRQASEIELQILELVERAPDGIGSGTLVFQLLDRGTQLSQPTVGRLLNALDHRGLTRKVANKGRVLTESGRNLLERARNQRQRARWMERMLAAVEPATLGELRDVLIARRALERETARLAAEHATPAEITEMRQALDAQRAAYEAEGQSNDFALAFHRMLAHASGNSFLALAADVLRNERHVLEVIMYHLGSTVGGESLSNHVEILDAVASRDPRAAERAMVRHMNQFIRYVDSLMASSKEIPLREGAPPLEPPISFFSIVDGEDRDNPS
jgi:GntR family transcriptional regulator, transcriptional repressor for pyruvate dehydrogenase complex